ncbi:protein LDOC1-like [Pleurodeles waltl]|uniref:protein LDOC1-like n=1 Tax=Pleurodeles waltl TaxID=8319 RepID=UPI0037097D7C
MDSPVMSTEPTSQTLLLTIQQQAQELQQLRTENTVYRQAFASRTTDVPTVSATTPRFSGDPNKLREFLDALTVYFAFRPSQFMQGKTKVGYLISALSGPAFAWATPLVQSNDPSLSNYSSFVTAFKQMFEHPGLESSAEEALCDIQHGNQDGLQYITRFRQLAA